MPIISARLSKVILTSHITFSVGWMGTVAAFLVLAIAGVVGNLQLVRACYISMELVAWFIIVPFCLASFFTGLIQSWFTQWGFNHYWIVVKLVLTVIATLVLLLHMKPITFLGEMATEKYITPDEFSDVRIRLIADAGAAILVLLVITTVSVYKPWGKIQFGMSLPKFQHTTKKPWGRYLLIGFIGVLVLFIIIHLMQGGMHH